LKKSSTPQLVEYTIDEANKLIPLDHNTKRKHYPIRIINVQGELFFGAAEVFGGALKSIAEDDISTRVIILRLKNARDIDATACLALEQLFNHLRQSNRHLLACGLTYSNWLVLCDSGVVEHIGKANLFILDENDPQMSLHRAIVRARQLLLEKDQVKQEERSKVSSSVILAQ
jgi:SulP family sulfate permease